ncbi:MAG: N-acetyltransferase [Alphaproteobacteria bacterium]|nr:N-acetyltransferase [Alphaproteobacteria bacterium]
MIRRAKADDIDKILKIWLETSNQAHYFIDKDYWQNMLSSVKNHYLPYAKTLVFEDKHQIKGFISITDEKHIGALFVAPKWQNKKIGRKLLKTAQRYYSLLSLNVFAKNSKAIEFYMQNDFKIVNEQVEVSTREKELKMCWSLGCKSGFIKRYRSDS